VIYRITRATRHFIFWFLIAIAISLTGARLLLSGMESYKTDLSVYLGEVMGAPVKIGRLRAKMRGFNPELVLTNIDISSIVAHEKPAIQLKEIRLGINLLDMLISRELLSSSWVTLVGAKLSVIRKQDGALSIVGLKAGNGQPHWLLEGGKYEILHSEIDWQDEQNRIKGAMNGVNVAIINHGPRHQLNMLMDLPAKYGDALRVSIDFTGNAFEPSAINGVAFIEGKNLQLAEWVKKELPGAIHIQSGRGNFKIWGRLQQSQLMALQGEVQLQQAQFLRQNRDAFPLMQLETGFYWGIQESAWRLDVNHFLLETADPPKAINKKWPNAIFSIAGQRAVNKSLPEIALYIEQLDLQEAALASHFFAPLSNEQEKILTQAQPKGFLKAFSLYADPDQKTFAVNGEFSRLTSSPVLKIPGIVNATGRIKGSHQQGALHLATENAQVLAPDLFREPLIIQRLNGSFDWRQTENDWTVSSPGIELDLLGLQSKNRLRLTIPKNNDLPFMDMQSSFVSQDVSQFKHYFPVHVMRQADINWLDRAFVSGRITKGSMLYYGKLGEFPRTGGSDVFEALLDIEQMELNYAPDWPPITDIAAEVLFLQDRMEVNGHHGLSNQLKITEATVINTALGRSKRLLVQGKVEGEVAHALDFLQQTPLHSRIDFLKSSIEPHGNTEVALDLDLPLAKGMTPKVNGAARLADARLKVESLDLWVTQINGDLKFNEQGVYSDTILAAALGYPIKVNIKNADSRTTVDIAGRIGMEALSDQFKIPVGDIADGTTDYQLQLQLPYARTLNISEYPVQSSDWSKPQLSVQSRLEGVTLNLPGALAKTRKQQKSLSLTFSLGDALLLPIELNYDNQLKAAVKLDTAQRQIYSGHILAGSGEAIQPFEAGLLLEVNEDQLDLHDLQNSVMQNKQGGNGINIREIKIHGKQALWNKTPLGFFDLALKPESGYWRGHINSAFAKGEIHIPVDFNGAGRVTLTMELLDLSLFKQLASKNSAQVTGLSPEVLPLFNISSHKTVWQSVDLGQLTVATERIPNGIAFKQIELTGLEQKLALSGTWTVKSKQAETHLQGRLQMARAGHSLSQLGITKDLMETRGTVDFGVHWDGAPYQFSLAALDGKIDVNLKEGRILSIEPGFGRILGMLALAQWAKRLQLDFRDIYEEGLTFNTIQGYFSLAKGKATTRNLIVDAIPAKITITGSTDYINKTVDQMVSVAPKSADAVPIAGTIMGEVTTLIARTLTGKDQEGFFFGSQYWVKGKWDQMEIIRLHENEGLLQKTWNGITDFPWLQPSDKP
jgi:uncharacterized protein (TIGR02099 family)